MRLTRSFQIIGCIASTNKIIPIVVLLILLLNRYPTYAGNVSAEDKTESQLHFFQAHGLDYLVNYGKELTVKSVDIKVQNSQKKQHILLTTRSQCPKISLNLKDDSKVVNVSASTWLTSGIVIAFVVKNTKTKKHEYYWATLRNHLKSQEWSVTKITIETPIATEYYTVNVFSRGLSHGDGLYIFLHRNGKKNDIYNGPTYLIYNHYCAISSFSRDVGDYYHFTGLKKYKIKK